MSDRRSFIHVNTGEEDIEHELNDEPHHEKIEVKTTFWFIPCRYVLVVWMAMGSFCAFAQRMVFNIALVAMVNFTETDDKNETADICPVDPAPPNSTNIHQEGEFNWDAGQQALLLGAFYYGYPISQLPFGYLAKRFGGRVIFAFNGFSTGILSLLIPVVARWNPYALIVLRAVQGFCQGSIYPTSLAMISRWGPPGEQTRMLSVLSSGSTLGSVFAMAVAGVMCQSIFLGGWPSTFYLFGGLSVLWSIVWLFIAYDSPIVHPRITHAEKEYITKETAGISKVKYSNPPWCSLLKSVPLWGIFIVICADNFGGYVISSTLPLYMKQVLHFDMTQDGLMSALPYLVQFPVCLLVGVWADAIRKRELLRVVNIRRIACLLGAVLPGLFLLAFGFVGCNKVAAVAFLMLSVGTNSFTLASTGVSIFDIAPLHAGTLMGILNGIANLFGIISPLVVAKITNNSGNLSEWRTVFWISAVVFSGGAIAYCLMISDKEQKWAKDKRQTEEADQDESETVESPSITI